MYYDFTKLNSRIYDFQTGANVGEAVNSGISLSHNEGLLVFRVNGNYYNPGGRMWPVDVWSFVVVTCVPISSNPNLTQYITRNHLSLFNRLKSKLYPRHLFILFQR